MTTSEKSAAELRGGLMALAAIIRSWVDWDKARRGENSPPLTTDDNTQIMSLPVPFWPSHGSFENWIALFQNCHDALSPDIRVRAIKECAEIIGNMRQSEAGLIWDAKHSGQRGKDRSDALYDAYHALMALTKGAGQ